MERRGGFPFYILSFVDDLTNWYVRRSRRRFWKSDNDSDKNFAYATLYKALIDFSKILAPFLPFLSEEIYQLLAREVAESMRDLILEELNVEELCFANDDAELAKVSAKPNFAGIKAKGAEYAKNMKAISAAISSLPAERIKEIQNGVPLDVSGLAIDAGCLMLVREVAEGLAVEADENYTAALDLKITPELRQSCIARELVNRIQNRRKEMDLQITDRIRISLRGVSAFPDLRAAVERHREYILEETQGDELAADACGGGGGEWFAASVEGSEVGVAVCRVV